MLVDRAGHRTSPDSPRLRLISYPLVEMDMEVDKVPQSNTGLQPTLGQGVKSTPDNSMLCVRRAETAPDCNAQDEINSICGVDNMSPTTNAHPELSMRIAPPNKPDIADVGAFPTEIWQLICSYLKFRDRAQLRLTCHGLAAIAAQFLVSRIRFHTSVGSLQRLQHIAAHPLMRKNVKTLVYEASLLADAGCVHSYASHFEMAHHEHERPKPPSEDDPSDRTKRLYERNKKKFDKEVEEKYEAYRTQYHWQQTLVNGPKDEYYKCIADFPNLQEVQLRTDARCRHVLSNRFVDEFSKDCAIPMGTNSTPTLWQLDYMLQRNLRKLVACTISVNFFDGSSSRLPERLADVFKSLQSVKLTLRMDPADLKQISEDSSTRSYQVLKKHVLSGALGAARNLRDLSVSFVPDRVAGPATKLEHVVGDYSWPKLKTVNIDFVESTQRQFLDFVRRQPHLHQLEVGFFLLTEGTWIDATKKLRQDFSGLRAFLPYGMLEDDDRQYNIELVHRDSWINGERWDLRMALDCYVGDHDAVEYDFDNDMGDDDLTCSLAFNPLEDVDDEFEEEDELEIEYGSVMDEEFFDMLGTTPPGIPGFFDSLNDVFGSDEEDSLNDYFGSSDGNSDHEQDFMDIDD